MDVATLPLLHSCSDEDLPISYEADPSSLDVLSILSGDLGIDLPVVAFVVVGHVDVARMYPELVYLGITLLNDAS